MPKKASDAPRVRFAPSPTGTPHLGNIRSALFNFLFSRHGNGRFILRIEDTDRLRLVHGAIDTIQDSLSWLGLAPDDGPGLPDAEFGPFIQSERLKLYQQYAQALLKNSFLYKDYSSPTRLDTLRKQAQAEGKPFKFKRELAQEEPENDEGYVLRFQVQSGADVGWEDAVFGSQKVQRDTLDDFVALKSDGWPTYHLANVVDDHLMKISHVIRAEEWIPSTPKHLLLYEAFGWQPPIFAHLPQVLGPDRSKLSKRHGAKSVLDYREAGYLPEALVNYLASLGFNDGTTKELYTIDELIEAFSLDRVQSSPAVFDADRLDWMNGHYIRELSSDELMKRCEGFWPPQAAKYDEPYKKRVLGLVRERLKYLGELPELTDFFFVDPKKRPEPPSDNRLLSLVIKELENSDFSEADLEHRLRGIVKDQGVKPGPLFGMIRVAITGRTAAPGLFETLHTLGKETSLRRLKTYAD